MQYTSVLNDTYSDDLERLLFFNQDQHLAYDSIVYSIEKYGSPVLHIEDGLLRIKLEKLGDSPSFFALDEDKLVGVLIYARIKPESLTMMYIAVDHEYSSRGEHASKMLVTNMLLQLRKSARRIAGVESIRIIRGEDQFQNFSV